MRIEVWHQDWTRAKDPVRPGDGPAGSKREIAEHFRDGRYTKVEDVEVDGDAWHGAADAVWRRPTAACRAGDVLIAHKGGMARRAAFVLMRDETGLRLQKIDMERDAGSSTGPEPTMEAPRAGREARQPALPAFITGSMGSNQKNRRHQTAGPG